MPLKPRSKSTHCAGCEGVNDCNGTGGADSNATGGAGGAVVPTGPEVTPDGAGGAGGAVVTNGPEEAPGAGGAKVPGGNGGTEGNGGNSIPQAGTSTPAASHENAHRSTNASPSGGNQLTPCAANNATNLVCNKKAHTLLASAPMFCISLAINAEHDSSMPSAAYRTPSKPRSESKHWSASEGAEDCNGAGGAAPDRSGGAGGAVAATGPEVASDGTGGAGSAVVITGPELAPDGTGGAGGAVGTTGPEAASYGRGGTGALCYLAWSGCSVAPLLRSWTRCGLARAYA